MSFIGRRVHPQREPSCRCPQARKQGQRWDTDTTGDGSAFLFCRWCGAETALGRPLYRDRAIGWRSFTVERKLSAWSTL